MVAGGTGSTHSFSVVLSPLPLIHSSNPQIAFWISFQKVAVHKLCPSTYVSVVWSAPLNCLLSMHQFHVGRLNIFGSQAFQGFIFGKPKSKFVAISTFLKTVHTSLLKYWVGWVMLGKAFKIEHTKLALIKIYLFFLKWGIHFLASSYMGQICMWFLHVVNLWIFY